MSTRSLPGAIALTLCPASSLAVLSVRLLPGGEEADHGPGPGGIRRSGSIFRQASPDWPALAPPRSGEPPPRQPCRVHGGGKVQALSSPSRSTILILSGLSPPLPVGHFLRKKPRRRLQGSSRDAICTLSNLIRHIVPQGPWLWQALISILAWLGKSPV